MNQRVTISLILLCCTGLLFYGFFADSSHAQSSFSQAQVKAAYILKMKEFITWPDSTSADTICVTGDDLVGTSLAFIIRADNKQDLISIEKMSKISSFSKCLILYIGKNDDDSVEQILRSVSSDPILTISDTDFFIDRGGMIGLVSNSNKVNFEINKRAAKKSGITFSSKILELSKRLIE